MSIHTALRTMLVNMNNGTIPDANIVYGTRSQFMSYPACSYLVQDNSTVTIGPSPIRMCTVTIKSIAIDAESAIALAEEVESVLTSGTYGSIVFTAVLNKNTVLQEPESSNGEESNPFVATTTASVYYQ